eukprot:TRINITY_DN42960_c0_g1_i1.p1 TRINITY_DN42960_c0_g1~~TRINITY_DN42960_c0_g1_i1.p1  ORF type:complete len:1211 (+),score=262.71 TRINITY_DN42960_c0_g1_i1:80-3634(+)
MPRGRLSKWVPERGFGFLTPEEGQAGDAGDVFFHRSALCGPIEGRLQVGAVLEYDHAAPRNADAPPPPAAGGAAGGGRARASGRAASVRLPLATPGSPKSEGEHTSPFRRQGSCARPPSTRGSQLSTSTSSRNRAGRMSTTAAGARVLDLRHCLGDLELAAACKYPVPPAPPRGGGALSVSCRGCCAGLEGFRALRDMLRACPGVSRVCCGGNRGEGWALGVCELALGLRERATPQRQSPPPEGGGPVVVDVGTLSHFEALVLAAEFCTARAPASPAGSETAAAPAAAAASERPPSPAPPAAVAVTASGPGLSDCMMRGSRVTLPLPLQVVDLRGALRSDADATRAAAALSALAEELREVSELRYSDNDRLDSAGAAKIATAFPPAVVGVSCPTPGPGPGGSDAAVAAVRALRKRNGMHVECGGPLTHSAAVFMAEAIKRRVPRRGAAVAVIAYGESLSDAEILPGLTMPVPSGEANFAHCLGTDGGARDLAEAVHSLGQGGRWRSSLWRPGATVRSVRLPLPDPPRLGAAALAAVARALCPSGSIRVAGRPRQSLRPRWEQAWHRHLAALAAALQASPGAERRGGGERHGGHSAPAAAARIHVDDLPHYDAFAVAAALAGFDPAPGDRPVAVTCDSASDMAPVDLGHRRSALLPQGGVDFAGALGCEADARCAAEWIAALRPRLAAAREAGCAAAAVLHLERNPKLGAAGLGALAGVIPVLCGTAGGCEVVVCNARGAGWPQGIAAVARALGSCGGGTVIVGSVTPQEVSELAEALLQLPSGAQAADVDLRFRPTAPLSERVNADLSELTLSRGICMSVAPTAAPGRVTLPPLPGDGAASVAQQVIVDLRRADMAAVRAAANWIEHAPAVSRLELTGCPVKGSRLLGPLLRAGLVNLRVSALAVDDPAVFLANLCDLAPNVRAAAGVRLLMLSELRRWQLRTLLLSAPCRRTAVEAELASLLHQIKQQPRGLCCVAVDCRTDACVARCEGPWAAVEWVQGAAARALWQRLQQDDHHSGGDPVGGRGSPDSMSVPSAAAADAAAAVSAAARACSVAPSRAARTSVAGDVAPAEIRALLEQHGVSAEIACMFEEEGVDGAVFVDLGREDFLERGISAADTAAILRSQAEFLDLVCARHSAAGGSYTYCSYSADAASCSAESWSDTATQTGAQAPRASATGTASGD